MPDLIKGGKKEEHFLKFDSLDVESMLEIFVNDIFDSFEMPICHLNLRSQNGNILCKVKCG